MFDTITDRLSSFGDNVSSALRRDKKPATGVWDGVDEQHRFTMDEAVAHHLHQALPDNPDALVGATGTAGRVFIGLVQRAASIQSGTVTSYVDWVRSKNPDASPARIQDILDKHFRLLASSSGGTAGLASAIPGVGLVTGSLAIGAESLVFTDAAALYTLASGYLRGANINDTNRREALILVTLLGSKGTALVDATIGELGAGAAGMSSRSTLKALTQMAPAGINDLNSRMTKVALKTATKRLLPAWFGKLLPFGIGAFIGWKTSKSLSKKVIAHARASLGPLPGSFPTPAPTAPAHPPVVVEAIEKAADDS